MRVRLLLSRGDQSTTRKYSAQAAILRNQGGAGHVYRAKRHASLRMGVRRMFGSKPFPLRGLECIAVKGLHMSANESTVVPEVGA